MEAGPSGILAVDERESLRKTALVVAADDGHHLCAEIDSQRWSRRQLTIAQLEAITGWQLTDDGPTEVEISDNSRPPVQVVILAANRDDVSATVEQIEARGYADVVAALSVSSTPTVPDLLKAITFDTVIATAASARDAGIMGAMIRLSSQLETSHPALVFAGPDEALKSFIDHLPSDATVVHLSSSELSRGRPDPKAVDAALFDRPHLETIQHAAGQPASDSQMATGCSPAITVLAETLRGSVCIFDVGATATTMTLTKAPLKSDSVRLESSYAGRGIRARLGNPVSAPSISSIKSWLPFDLSDATLRDYLVNASLLPCARPTETTGFLIEQAIARACGRSVAARETKTDFLVASGALASFPRLNQSVLALLDIAQPTAPCRIFIDSSNLLNRFDELCGISPDAALSLLKSDTLVNAGVCLSLLGEAKPDEAVAEIGVMRQGSGAEAGKEEIHAIRFGTITVIPLRAAEQISLRVTTARRFTFGIEPDRPWAAPSAEVSRNMTEGVAGGLMGIIIDARGRPMALPEEASARRARLGEWLVAVDAFQAGELPNVS